MKEAINNLQNHINADVINYMLIIALLISAITLSLAFNVRKKISQSLSANDLERLRIKQKPIVNLFFASIFAIVTILLLKLILSLNL